MASTSRARAAFSVRGTLQKAGNLTTAANSFARSETFMFPQGPGVGQVNLAMHGSSTFTDATPVTVDLLDFTDLFDETGRAFSSIRLFAARHLGNDYTIEVFGSLPWFSSSDVLKAGTSILRVSWSHGWTVNASYHTVYIRRQGSGSDASTTCEWLFAGVSA